MTFDPKEELSATWGRLRGRITNGWGWRMRLLRHYHVAIYLLLALVGALLVALSISCAKDGLLEAFLRSVGIGLIAAGTTTLVIQWSDRKTEAVVRVYPSEFTPLGYCFPSSIHAASKIDCLAIANFAVVESLLHGELRHLLERVYSFALFHE
jgi:hypothetical protein